jgi:hypothetical protein
MSIFLAAWLAALPDGELPRRLHDDEPPPPRTEAFVRARGGVYVSHAFTFEAVRSTGLQVSVDPEALGSAGIDVGVSIRERVTIFASAEGAAGDGVELRVAGLYLGFRERLKPPYPPAMPHEVTAYAGGLWGRLEIRETGFGGFEDGWGFGAGLQFTWFLSRRWAFSALGEYRHLSFKYDEDVVSGDTRFGGSGAWGGLALEARF